VENGNKRKRRKQRTTDGNNVTAVVNAGVGSIVKREGPTATIVNRINHQEWERGVTTANGGNVNRGGITQTIKWGKWGVGHRSGEQINGINVTGGIVTRPNGNANNKQWGHRNVEWGTTETNGNHLFRSMHHMVNRMEYRIESSSRMNEWSNINNKQQ